MQLRLPIFLREATLISPFVGVWEQKEIVQYFINGVPSFAHKKGDHQSFRYIIGCYIDMKLCSKAEACRCFSVSPESVTKWHKKYVSEGGDGFFGKDARQGGKSHKIIGEVALRIQSKLDKGQSNLSIAKEEGLAESAIRYALKQGYLKKILLKKPLLLQAP